MPSSLNIEDYRSCQMKPILEIVPQSFARMDYTKRQALINYNYDPRKPTTSAAATTSSSARKGRKPRKDQDDHSSREHSEEDEDGEETEEDQDEEEAEKKRRKNMVVILKFGDKTPLHHPHGSHPTRWNSYKSDYRGFKLLERIRKVFTLIPGKPTVDVRKYSMPDNLVHIYVYYSFDQAAIGRYLRLRSKASFVSRMFAVCCLHV